MSGSSRERVDLGEMLLPLEPCEPASPPPPAPLPGPRPEPGPDPARRSRRGRQEPPPLPSPKVYADEVLRNIQLGQAEVTETWGATVDILTRQIQGEVTRLSEASTRTTAEMREAVRQAEATAGSLIEQLRGLMRELQETVEAQTTALRDAVREQGETLAASTREAASNIGTARHELSLSVAELKRRTFRHGVLLGGGTAILVLLLARLLFPFWGMQRPDVEAWSRGTELTRTYHSASPREREAILRTLGWKSMPGAAPAPPSTSSAPRADGR